MVEVCATELNVTSIMRIMSVTDLLQKKKSQSLDRTDVDHGGVVTEYSFDFEIQCLMKRTSS